MMIIEFLDIDDDALEKVAGCLNDESLGALTKTTPGLHGLFAQEMRQRYANQLMLYILQGNAEQVVKIVTDHPELLFIENCSGYDFAMDEFGNRRKIAGTPFRAILGAGDVDLLNKIMPHLSAYQEEIQQQHQQQFPQGMTSDPRIDYDFKKLLKVIQADPCKMYLPNATTEAVLAQFRAEMRQTKNQGFHFDIRILQQAHAAYEKTLFPDWEQNFVYAFRVVGYLQRLVSTCDAQAICEGLGESIKSDQVDLKQRKLVVEPGKPYYPTQIGPKGLGFESAYNYLNGSCVAVVNHSLGLGTIGSIKLKNYIEKKIPNILNLNKDERKFSHII